MLKIISENARSVKRLIAAQIFVAVFSFLIIFATALLGTVNILISVFCVCFYLFFIYTFMWEAGAKAAARKAVPDKKAAFKISAAIMLTANLFNILCAVTYAVCKFVYAASGNTDRLFVEIGNFAWMFVKYTQAMYLGIETAIFRPQEGVYLLANPLYFFLIVIPPVAMGIAAYMLGWSEFSILRKMGFNVKHEYKSENTYKSNWK